MRTKRAALGIALVLVSLWAVGQGKVDLVTPTTTPRWGSAFTMQATVSGCPTAPSAAYAGTLSLNDLTIGSVVGSGGFIPAQASGCPGVTVPLTYDWMLLPPNFQFLQVVAGLTSGGTVKSVGSPIRFDHEFDLAFRGDRVQATLSTDPRWTNCTRRVFQILDRESVSVPMPPPNVRTPYEMFSLAAGGCTPGTLRPRVAAALEIPETVGDLWVYQAGTGWRLGVTSYCSIPGVLSCPPVVPSGPGFIPATFFNKAVLFELDSNGGDMQAIVAIAYPQPDARGGDQQGLWWAGPAESGWGLTIARNGERLFVAGFIYDGLGKPTWVVMPNGQWDPNTFVFYGDLYSPKGAPYYSYASVGFEMGSPVGTGSLSFLSGDQGHFDYTLGDFSGGKTINRFVFAPPGKDKPPYSGIWWGGALQDGWGLSVEQQGETIFATWYTYSTEGQRVWFYMPAGQKTGTGKYAGTLYRTTGSAWAGFHYNGASTQSIAVGTMELQFAADGKSATMTSVVDGRTVVNPIQRFDF